MGFLDSVKGFAGKVGDAVENGAKSVSDTTKKMSEKSKVNSEIKKVIADRNSAYLEIGKKYFEKHSASPDEEYAQFVNDIIAMNNKLDELQIKLASFDDKVRCVKCGAELSKTQQFCDKCGAKVEIIEPAVAEPVKEEAAAEEQPKDITVCPNCNEVLEPGQKFCSKCGTKIEG